MKNKTVTCIDLNGKKYKVPVNKLAFRPSVYGIITQNNKVLLVKQWDGYDIPGGGVEIGEILEEALKREVFEETGLEIKIGKVIHTQSEFLKLPHVGKFVESILLYYSCQIIGGKITDEYFDKYEKKYAAKAEWVEIRKLKNFKFYNQINNEKVINEAIKINNGRN